MYECLCIIIESIHHKYNYLIIHNSKYINRIHYEIPIAYPDTIGH